MTLFIVQEKNHHVYQPHIQDQPLWNSHAHPRPIQRMVRPLPVSKTGVGRLNRELALTRQNILSPAVQQYQALGRKVLLHVNGSKNEQSTGRDSSADSGSHGCHILSRVYPTVCGHTLYPGALKVCRLDRRVEETHQRTVS